MQMVSNQAQSLCCQSILSVVTVFIRRESDTSPKVCLGFRYFSDQM